MFLEQLAKEHILKAPLNSLGQNFFIEICECVLKGITSFFFFFFNKMIKSGLGFVGWLERAVSFKCYGLTWLGTSCLELVSKMDVLVY